MSRCVESVAATRDERREPEDRHEDHRHVQEQRVRRQAERAVISTHQKPSDSTATATTIGGRGSRSFSDHVRQQAARRSLSTRVKARARAGPACRTRCDGRARRRRRASRRARRRARARGGRSCPRRRGRAPSARCRRRRRGSAARRPLVGPVAVECRSNLRAASDLVEREGELDVVEPAGRLQPVHERGRPEMVAACPVYGRSSAPVATSHTSHAGVRLGGEARASATSVADPGRVVVRAGRGRDAVGVRHRDHQAVARRVPDPDHVARRPLAGHAEPLIADAQPDGAEARRHPLVRAPLRRRRGRPRPLARERHRELVRLGAPTAAPAASAQQAAATRSEVTTPAGYSDYRT